MGLEMDGLISRFFKATRDANILSAKFSPGLKHFSGYATARSFPGGGAGRGIADILIAEVKDATGWAVTGISSADATTATG